MPFAVSPARVDKTRLVTNSVRHWWLGGIAHLCLFTAVPAFAAGAEDFAGLLQRADTVKSVDPGEFTRLLDHLHAQLTQLSLQQREHLQYLQGWRHAYAGNYAAAIPLLESIVDQSSNHAAGVFPPTRHGD